MRILLTRIKTEMSFSFSVSGTSEEKYILSGGCNLGELVESESLSFRLGDSGSGSVGELESTNSETFRKIQQSIIIGDGSNNSNNSLISAIFIIFGSLILTKNSTNSGERNRITIQSRLIESFMNSSVEFRFSSSGQE